MSPGESGRVWAGVLAIAVVACTSASTPATSRATPEATSPTASTNPVTDPERTIPVILDALDGESCPESDFTCVTLEVSLNHFDDSDRRVMHVTFAVLPAENEPEGVFVTVTGGPGVSGLLSADSYTAVFDETIHERFDIVFFDQRGVGASAGVNCPEAAVAYYRTDLPTTSVSAEQETVTAAGQFVDRCLEEMGHPPELPFFSTAQAVEDLEQFRETLGYDQMVLYGESYGTQFVQTYAAAHPDRVERLILDGTVDLTLDGFEFYAQQTAAFARTLENTFEACDADPGCRADTGSPAAVAYDRLAAVLAEGPVSVEFPLPDGGSQIRKFRFADLEIIAGGQMYGEDHRMLFARALASYGSRGDLIPLFRLLYPNLGTDPADESVIEDPLYSDAAYYAVECLDYAFPGNTPEETTAGFFQAGAALEQGRLSSFAYGDLPCAFWPQANKDPDRPKALRADGIPTVVLTAEADPATPYENGLAVFGHLAEGYLITQSGGPHVIFGRGNTCPDEAVTAFILEGIAPPKKSSCEGTLMDEYVRILPRSAGEFESAREMLEAIENEVYYLPEFYYWDGVENTAAGCSLGGTLTMKAPEEYQVGFTDCELTKGSLLNGTASYDWENDIFQIDVAVGRADCRYSYTRTEDQIVIEDDCASDPFGG